MTKNFRELDVHLFHILTFDTGDNWTHLYRPIIEGIKKFRNKHIIAIRSKDVSNDSVPATIDTKDVFYNEEDSFSLAHMVGGDSFDVDLFSFGGILNFELWQGAGRTALHQDKKIC